MVYNDKKKIIKDKGLPLSVRDVARMYPTNQVNRQQYGGLPHIGNALWGTWKSKRIQDAADAYDNYSLSDNLLIPGFRPPRVGKIRLGGGSPARFDPYQKSIYSIKKALENRMLSDYPMAAGDEGDKTNIIDYLNKKCHVNANNGNIIFTHSSTQGFNLVMEAILDYGDIVLMTAPNYGLFSFIPERVGGRVELLELRAKDNWRINTSALKKEIKRLNSILRTDYDRNRGKYIFRRSDKPPKVAAFLNINPHNPTGVVYGKKDKALLEDISTICKDYGVFVIDDLAYSGLEFDRKNLAIPIASLEGHFNNTISLYTLSKSYGLAGIRSGLIVANDIVVSLIRDTIFQMSDSLSVIQSAAMSAVFDISKESQKERKKYFDFITTEYKNRYVFVKAIIEGVGGLNAEEVKLFNKLVDGNSICLDRKVYCDGIKDVEVIIEPESGFFILLDLSRLIGKSYKGYKIIDDETLLKFLYTSNNIKLLTGKAFCWPNPHQLVVRVTTAMDYGDLLTSFIRLKKSIDSLD